MLERAFQPIMALLHITVLIRLAGLDLLAGHSVVAQQCLVEGKLTAEAVMALLKTDAAVPPPTAISVTEVALSSFDELLGGGSEVLQ